MKRRLIYRQRLILFFLLLPLVFVNVSSQHDWGDDFAQYLMQARNMVSGIPQTENGMFFLPEDPPFAVTSYPAGFPLILSPLYAVFGTWPVPYHILLSLMLIGISMLFAEGLRLHFNGWLSTAITLFFAYHYGTLSLKSEIISEIPFTLLLISFFPVFTRRKKIAYLVLAGIILGMLMSVRITGMLMIPSLLIWAIVMRFSSREKVLLNECLGVILISLGVFILLNSVIFPSAGKEFFGFYREAFRHHETQLWANLTHYRLLAGDIFALPAFHNLWSWLVFITIMCGFISMFKRYVPGSLFFMFYMIMLIFYPYTSAGFRFLFPVLPLMLFYFFTGVVEFCKMLKHTYLTPTLLSTLLLLVMFGQNLTVLRSQPSAKTVSGPYSPSAMDAWNHIGMFTSPSSVILFPKARTIPLFTGRRATYFNPSDSNAEIHYKLKKNGISLVLVPGESTGAGNEKFYEYVTEYRMDYDTTWTNVDFVLLARRD